MRTVKRIAEEEYILVVLLAGFGLIFLLIFPPALLVNDSWLNLMAGREVVENGLPSRDELTVYGLGSTWTDQQWLAQIFMYGVYSLGGYALLSMATCAQSSCPPSRSPQRERARSARARARSGSCSFPYSWRRPGPGRSAPRCSRFRSTRASSGSSRQRRDARRGECGSHFRLLVVWANVHGSVALGALLVMLLGVYELVRSRGRSGLRSLALIVLAPLAVLATPYGPVATARYYHLMLVDPPFAGRVTEWQLGGAGREHDVLLRARRDRDPARLPRATPAERSSTSPFSPHARRRRDRDPRNRLVRARVHASSSRSRSGASSRAATRASRGVASTSILAIGLATALVAVAGSLFLRDDSWYEEQLAARARGGRAR